MKKLLADLLTGALALSLVACTSGETGGSETGDPSGTQSADGGHVIGYAGMDLSVPFQITMRDAVQAAVEAKGDKFISVDGALDQTKQNNGIEDMITQGIEVLVLNPVDSQGVQPALEACQQAGVKVVVVDSNVADTSLTETFVSSDNYQAGQLCGEEMLRLFPDGAKLCIIENPLAESVVQRVKGVEDAIAGSNIVVADRKSISTMDKVLTTTEDLLQANPDVEIFFGLNDDVALIIQGSVESAGLQDQVKVFGVDGSPQAKQSVAAGGLYATAAQSPMSIGTKAAECVYAILNGESVEKDYKVETSLVTPDNVEEVGVDNWA